MAAQLVDEPLTRVGAGSPRPRRQRLPPTDPRRAPGGVDADASDPAADAAPALATPPSGSAAGLAAIRAALKTMPSTPGVYRMLDRRGDALYVGKARSLKNRVQNYTHTA